MLGVFNERPTSTTRVFSKAQAILVSVKEGMAGQYLNHLASELGLERDDFVIKCGKKA
jgi:hypothetical protein